MEQLAKHNTKKMKAKAVVTNKLKHPEVRLWLGTCVYQMSIEEAHALVGQVVDAADSAERKLIPVAKPSEPHPAEVIAQRDQEEKESVVIYQTPVVTEDGVTHARDW